MTAGPRHLHRHRVDALTLADKLTATGSRMHGAHRHNGKIPMLLAWARPCPGCNSARWVGTHILRAGLSTTACSPAPAGPTSPRAPRLPNSPRRVISHAADIPAPVPSASHPFQSCYTTHLGPCPGPCRSTGRGAPAPRSPDSEGLKDPPLYFDLFYS